MYDRLNTNPDAQPLSYGGLVGAKTTSETPLSLTKNHLSHQAQNSPSHLFNHKTTFMYYSRTSI